MKTQRASAAAATFLDDHKVGLATLVDLPNAAKQKANTGVLPKEKEREHLSLYMCYVHSNLIAYDSQ